MRHAKILGRKECCEPRDRSVEKVSDLEITTGKSSALTLQKTNEHVTVTGSTWTPALQQWPEICGTPEGCKGIPDERRGVRPNHQRVITPLAFDHRCFEAFRNTKYTPVCSFPNGETYGEQVPVPKCCKHSVNNSLFHLKCRNIGQQKKLQNIPKRKNQHIQT